MMWKELIARLLVVFTDSPFLLLVLVVLILGARLVLSAFVARRGEIIAEMKGIDPKEAHIFRFASFITFFFGVIIAYLLVILFANALPDRGGYEE